MNSQQNVLQVLACGFTGPQATQAALADLPEGELAFYTKANVRATTGAGRFVLNNGGVFIESNYVAAFAGWGEIKSYAAPVLRKETLTITNATALAYYQIQVIMDIKGMTGKYIKQGIYKAITGDTTTTIATALAASLNAALTREGSTALTVTSSGAIITIVGRAQTYVPGKKIGFQVPFTSSITSPDSDVAAGVVSTNFATGTVTLDSGGSGSVDGIVVNAVEIMSGAESFASTLAVTATAVAANITAHTSVPNYSAVAVGAVITITSEETGKTPNAFDVTSSTTTIVSTDVDMSGGYFFLGDNGVGTGNYVHSKEFFAWGNQDSFRHNSWRNSFEPKVLSDSSGTYDVIAVNEDKYEKTAHADVRVSTQILIAFDAAGDTPAT